MPLQILNLGKMFRPGTSHIYPPFKKGRYMEEYVYEYLTENEERIVLAVIQWLGTPVGQGFISELNRE
jgi:hypothetical protein